MVGLTCRGSRAVLWLAAVTVTAGIALAQSPTPAPARDPRLTLLQGLINFFQLRQAAYAYALTQTPATPGATGSFDGLSNVILDQMALLPPSLNTTPKDRQDGAIRSVFGGTVRVLGKGESLGIQFDGLGKAACAGLVMTTASRLGKGGEAESIAINGRALPQGYAPSIGATLCTDTDNVLIWRLSLVNTPGVGAPGTVLSATPPPQDPDDGGISVLPGTGTPTPP